jgi:lipoprotein-anchoring transpeptidase ErfK/SrfK
MDVRALLLAFVLSIATTATQAAIVDVNVDLSQQKMEVVVAGYREFSWDISSARSGYETPTGKFRVNWMTPMHYSEQYQYSPMPYSIFFHQGFAIHATNEINRLGRPASHGCIRLSPENAKILYRLVELYGMSNVIIEVRNDQSALTVPAREHSPLRMFEQRF